MQNLGQFKTFLDIRENAEWRRFLAHPIYDAIAIRYDVNILRCAQKLMKKRLSLMH